LLSERGEGLGETSAALTTLCVVRDRGARRTADAGRRYGYAEGVINKVKVIKRRAYGLPTFDGFRERVLIASCG
jgi:transposase